MTAGRATMHRGALAVSLPMSPSSDAMPPLDGAAGGCARVGARKHRSYKRPAPRWTAIIHRFDDDDQQPEKCQEEAKEEKDLEKVVPSVTEKSCVIISKVSLNQLSVDWLVEVVSNVFLV